MKIGSHFSKRKILSAIVLYSNASISFDLYDVVDSSPVKIRLDYASSIVIRMTTVDLTIDLPVEL